MIRTCWRGDEWMDRVAVSVPLGATWGEWPRFFHAHSRAGDRDCPSKMYCGVGMYCPGYPHRKQRRPAAMQQEARALFSSEGTVALSFVYGKYCPIID
jgi:hypothetical protein